MSQKYYVVWKGKQPGIYTNWEDCKHNIHGVKGAKFKSYKTKEEASSAFKNGENHTDKNTSNKIIKDSIAVDAACSGNPGKVEYQGVHIGTNKHVFKSPKIPMGTNNLGEFLAIVHGLQYLKENKLDIPIYTDSRTAMKWVHDKTVKSTLPQNNDTRLIWSLTHDAIVWLKENTYTTSIIEWDTHLLGEIPADFGRK